MLKFYTPENVRKPLMFSESIEMEHWAKMGLDVLVNFYLNYNFAIIAFKYLPQFFRIRNIIYEVQNETFYMRGTFCR